MIYILKIIIKKHDDTDVLDSEIEGLANSVILIMPREEITSMEFDEELLHKENQVRQF